MDHDADVPSVIKYLPLLPDCDGKLSPAVIVVLPPRDTGVPFMVMLEFVRPEFGIVDTDEITPDEFVVTYPAVVIGVVMVPVKVGEAIGAYVVEAVAEESFKSSAVCVAVEIGFRASVVLSTFPRPTIDLLIPETVPVNVGEASGALAAIELVTVVAKAASPPKASDNSFRVFKVVGAELTKFDIAVSV